MAWLDNIKTSSPVMETKASNWTGSGIVRQPYVKYNNIWDIERATKDALTKVTWVYRCVQAIASNAARVPMIVRNNNAFDGVPVKNHSLYYPLNSKANPGESSYVFRYRLSAQILLSNKGAFVEIVRNRAGEVSRLDLIPPQFVTPIPDSTNFVSGYEVRVPEAKSIVADNSFSGYSGFTLGPKMKELKPEDVLWIRNPHPFDVYGSLTPLESLGLAIETDWYAKMYNRNFLLNDGRPGGLVVIKGDATPEDREELNARFRGNIMMAGRISVITSEQGADFVDTAVNPRDAQYIETRKTTKEEILLGFGVPESVLSNASGRTFDNADVERVIFWQETIIPHLELITREFDVLDDNQNHYMGVDLDRVDVLQRMDMKRKEFAMREKDAGLIDTDEYREETGRKPTGTPQGKVLFRANTAIPFTTTTGDELPSDTHGLVNAPMPDAKEAAKIASDVARRNAAAAARVSQGGQAGPGQPADGTVKPQPEAEPPVRNDQRPKPLPNAPKKSEISDEAKESFSNDIERWTMVAEGAVKLLTDRQKRVLVEKVNGQKTRRMLQKRSRIIESGSSSEPGNNLSIKAAVDSVFDQSIWDRQMMDDLGPVMRGVYKEFGKARAELLDETSEEADYVITHELKTICGVNTIVKEAIEEGFAAYAMAEDEAIEPSELILSFYEDGISEKITELVKSAVVAVANGSIWDSSRLVGGSVKTWVSLNGSSGPKVKTIPLEDNFSLGEAKIRYPGDPSDHSRKSHGLAILVIE